MDVFTHIQRNILKIKLNTQEFVTFIYYVTR